MTPLTGGLEAGGTKFVCALGTGPGDLRAETRFLTTTPDETIGRAVDFFRAQRRLSGELASIGIGSFGPLDLDPESSGYGHITSTPKPGWADVDIVRIVKEALDCPIGFDTDVNAAALAEWRWGAARGLTTFIYLTVGTGVGGGGFVNGRRMHGLLHPEMGHIRIPHDLQHDPYPGNCMYHGDCLEGLVTGPAIEKRWKTPPEKLPPDHPAWELEAHYLALAVANFICTLSPQRIIIGGGVMEQRQLFPLIRRQAQALLGGYISHSDILENIDEYVVPPALGRRSGVCGAIALAQEALTNSESVLRPGLR